MRQAYDYWQNQPGNYREPRATAPGASLPGRAPRRRPGQLSDRGGPQSTPGPGTHPGALPLNRGSYAGHPIAPTEIPKRRSAAEITLDPRGPCPGDTAACASQEEDTVRRSRPRAAIDSGLPPNVLRIMFAIGQPSTDSVGARRYETYGSSGTGAAAAVRP